MRAGLPVGIFRTVLFLLIILWELLQQEPDILQEELMLIWQCSLRLTSRPWAALLRTVTVRERAPCTGRARTNQPSRDALPGSAGPDHRANRGVRVFGSGGAGLGRASAAVLGVETQPRTDVVLAALAASPGA